MLCVLFGVVCIELPICLVTVLLLEKYYGKHKGEHALDKLFTSIKGDENLFYKFFIFVLIEELFARYLLLGFLYSHPLFNGTFWFYLSEYPKVLP